MTQAAFNQILEQLGALEPDELRQLSQVVQRQLDGHGLDVKQATFHQALCEAGLVQQIKSTRGRSESSSQSIPVQGLPVSQTILEERR